MAAFLEEANKNTYANKEVAKAPSTRLRSDDYRFEKDELIYHDTYFGARDFIGEEIVYENQKATWGLNYYGFITSATFHEKEVYDILRKALMKKCGDIIPVRGPKEFSEEKWKYVNSVQGNLDRFHGKEEILVDGNSIYECLYHGGYVL